MLFAKDKTGEKFGRLTVLGRHEKSTLHGAPRWICRCVCGNITTVWGFGLTSGRTKSCGCLRKETVRGPSKPKTHCKAGHKLTKQNTYQLSRGPRVCKICEKARRLATYYKSKLAQSPK